MKEIKYTILFCFRENFCHSILFRIQIRICLGNQLRYRSDRIRNHNIDKNEEPPEYGEGEWNTGSVKAGSGIRGAGKRGVDCGECESEDWNTGVRKWGVEYRECENGELNTGSAKWEWNTGSGIWGV